MLLMGAIRMRQAIKIVSIVLIVIVAFTIGILLYENETFVSTEQLQFKLQQPANPVWSYAGTFYSGKTDVAEIATSTGGVEPPYGLASFTFYISHSSGILDSLYLELTPANGGFIVVYLEKPESQIWPSMIFQSSPDGTGTIVGVSNLGSLGMGTLGLNFYLEPQNGANSFWFAVNFTMRPTGFPQTRQAGSTLVELPITYANTT
jgi:hypothetical protein